MDIFNRPRTAKKRHLRERVQENWRFSLWPIFQTLQFSANLVKIGLLVLLVCTIGQRVPWKSRPALFRVLAFSHRLRWGPGLSIPLLANLVFSRSTIRMAGFLFCTLVWLLLIVRPERSSEFKLRDCSLPIESLEKMQKMLHT